jgi:hypothetical protein
MEALRKDFTVMGSPNPSGSTPSDGQKLPENHSGQSPKDSTNPDQFVVFADMLGFAALTEAHPTDVRALLASNRPGSLDFLNMIFRSTNPLTEAFSRFHRQVKWGIMMAEMSYAVTAISFSDSVFFASSSFGAAAGFAADLAHSMLSQRVPVRIGIATGSFAALRFRSDVSPDSGDHAAQFLGTAVVRAHDAEKCGIKGMRVLTHPSLQPLLVQGRWADSALQNASRTFRFLEVPDTERANKAQVRYEMDYWNLAPTKERDAWRGLQDMWEAAPDSVQEHYQATAGAVNRMRVAQGESPLTNLRRRSLPRRPR